MARDKSRDRCDASDVAVVNEEHSGNKYSSSSLERDRKRHRKVKMAYSRRSPVDNGHLARQPSRRSRRWRDQHTSDDKYSDESLNSRDRQSRKSSAGEDKSESHHTSRDIRSKTRSHADAKKSDDEEVLLKDCALRRAQRLEAQKEALTRQLQHIDEAQPEARRRCSPGAVVAESDPKHNKLYFTAKELSTQLKGKTDAALLWITRGRHTPGGPKNERRGKHGKKKQSLSPSTRKWFCYNCGKCRSAHFHRRRGIKLGEDKQAPNWCGSCRVRNKSLEWKGLRHYCFGCGIVRSEAYCEANPLDGGKTPLPNYCQPCREQSPTYSPKVPEKSEYGSEANFRDRAFLRQVRAAEESANEDNSEEDRKVCNVPDKKLMRSRSFVLEHCAVTTQAVSDDSVVTENIPEDSKRGEDSPPDSTGGGARLSATSCVSLRTASDSVNGDACLSATSSRVARTASDSSGGGVRLSAAVYRAPNTESEDSSGGGARLSATSSHFSHTGLDANDDGSLESIDVHGGGARLSATSSAGTDQQSKSVSSTESSAKHHVKALCTNSKFEKRRTSSSSSNKNKIKSNSKEKRKTQAANVRFAQEQSRPPNSNSHQTHDSGSIGAAARSTGTLPLKKVASRSRLIRDPSMVSTGSPPEREDAKENGDIIGGGSAVSEAMEMPFVQRNEGISPGYDRPTFSHHEHAPMRAPKLRYSASQTLTGMPVYEDPLVLGVDNGNDDYHRMNANSSWNTGSYYGTQHSYAMPSFMPAYGDTWDTVNPKPPGIDNNIGGYQDTNVNRGWNTGCHPGAQTSFTMPGSMPAYGSAYGAAGPQPTSFGNNMSGYDDTNMNGAWNAGYRSGTQDFTNFSRPFQNTALHGYAGGYDGNQPQPTHEPGFDFSSKPTFAYTSATNFRESTERNGVSGTQAPRFTLDSDSDDELSTKRKRATGYVYDLSSDSDDSDDDYKFESKTKASMKPCKATSPAHDSESGFDVKPEGKKEARPLPQVPVGNEYTAGFSCNNSRGQQADHAGYGVPNAARQGNFHDARYGQSNPYAWRTNATGYGTPNTTGQSDGYGSNNPCDPPPNPAAGYGYGVETTIPDINPAEDQPKVDKVDYDYDRFISQNFGYGAFYNAHFGPNAKANAQTSSSQFPSTKPYNPDDTDSSTFRPLSPEKSARRPSPFDAKKHWPNDRKWVNPNKQKATDGAAQEPRSPQYEMVHDGTSEVDFEWVDRRTTVHATDPSRDGELSYEITIQELGSNEDLTIIGSGMLEDGATQLVRYVYDTEEEDSSPANDGVDEVESRYGSCCEA